jgi:uroporphyrinogen-III synthase
MTGVLLVLRPEPGVKETLDRARDAGWDAVGYSLFATEAVPWVPPGTDHVDAVMVTSAQAVRHGGEGIRAFQSLPAYAVGPSTAKAMRRAGFRSIDAGSGGVQALVALIARRGHARVLHISGAEVRGYDSGPLQIIRRIVYRTVPVGDAAGLLPLLEDVGCVLVHSARAGQRLAQLVPLAARSSARLVAISNAALEASGPGWAAAEAASQPNDTAMLALAAALCD